MRAAKLEMLDRAAGQAIQQFEALLSDAKRGNPVDALKLQRFLTAVTERARALNLASGVPGGVIPEPKRTRGGTR